MRPQEWAHWHIDQLTAAASLLGAFVEEQGDECALGARRFANPDRRLRQL